MIFAKRTLLSLVLILSILISVALAAPTTSSSSTKKTTTTSSSSSSTKKTTTTTSSSSTKITTTSSTKTSSSSTSSAPTSAPTGDGTYQTALVIASDATAADEAVSILNGYGQPTYFLPFAANGTSLPVLEAVVSGKNIGNYGLIIIIGLVTYDYGGTIGWASAITTAQWNTLYAYQLKYGVRMVHLDGFPGSFNGTAIATNGPNGCCAYGEQYVALNNASFIPTSGLKVANLSTVGLWHYPAIITDATSTSSFLTFAANANYTTSNVAGVIQNFAGREQMVFFVEGASWSLTSNYMGHVWFHWGYRGLYNGFRRVAMHMQIDDMFLDTDIWNVTTLKDPEGQRSRINTTDLQMHMTWVPQFQATLNPGSVFMMETGFNGNGNMDYVGDLTTTAAQACPDSANVDDPIGPSQNLEWLKPLGTGVNMWIPNAAYIWTLSCILMDPLAQFFQTTSNRDSFAWISHTFTHEDLENATYYDTNLQMAFNYQHAKLLGLANAKYWSNSTFIPPGITGMHNGDALKAFMDNGIVAGVGDSTRPALLNPNNTHWPLITTVAGNGYAGYTIIPRWATRIYYNVGNQNEAADEWRSLSPTEADTGAGDIYALLAYELEMQVGNILGLHRAPFMFHQANLRVADVATTTINGVTKQRSLYQMWAETIGPAFTKLANWPLIAIKEDQLVSVFTTRMTKDKCNPTTQLIYAHSGNVTTITGFTVGATGNTCAAPIPVTLPSGNVTSLQGSTVEQVGNDPMTLWVTLSGAAKTFTLTTPITLT